MRFIQTRKCSTPRNKGVKRTTVSDYQVLTEGMQESWRIRSHDPRLQELMKDIDSSHRSVRLGGHTDEY